MNWQVGPDPAIDLLIDLSYLRRREGARRGKVETQAIRLNQRAALLNLRAEQVAKCFVEQVRRTVVTHRIFTPLGVDRTLHTIANTHVTLADMAIVNDKPLQRAARVLHLEDTHRSAYHPLVAYLTSALRVERSCIEQQQRLLWGADALGRFTVHNEAHDLAAAGRSQVARKLGWADSLEHFRENLIILTLRESSCCPAALLLALHSLLKCRDVHAETMFSRHLLRKLEREAVRIVQLKSFFARDDALVALLQIFEQRVEQVQTGIECLAELLLLQAQNLHDTVALRA